MIGAVIQHFISIRRIRYKDGYRKTDFRKVRFFLRNSEILCENLIKITKKHLKC